MDMAAIEVDKAIPCAMMGQQKREATMAELKIEGWDSMTEIEHSVIQALVDRKGLMKPGDRIVEGQPTSNPLCELVCEGIYAAAVVACGGSPPCIIIATLAREECKDAC